MESEEKSKDSKSEAAKASIEDGTYTAEFKTDSTMFHVNEANEGKGTLTVEDGKMTIHISLVSKNIVNLFPGTAKEAQKKGAKLLSDLGYKKISSFVKNHMELKAQMEDEINEASILYFADKLVIEDQFTSIEKRFEEKLKKYDLDDVIKKNIRKRYNTTLKIKSNIISIIGEVEYEKLEEKWRLNNDLSK